jgi:hypothetical protein
MHWMQKPENRERVRRQISKMHRAKKRNGRHGKHSAATRRKMSIARKAVIARKAAAAVNGHAVNGTVALHLNGHALTPPMPITGRKLAKAAVMRLAVDGARQQLARLDKDREVLLMFIQAAMKAEA